MLNRPESLYRQGFYKTPFHYPYFYPYSKRPVFRFLSGPVRDFTGPKHGFPSPRPAIKSQTKIIPEMIDLMHPLVQDCDDAYVTVG